MSRREMETNGHVDERLVRLVAEQLREEVPVRVAWRAALERALGEQEALAPETRIASRASHRPWRLVGAIAAGLVWAAAGAAVAVILLGRAPGRSMADPVSVADSAMTPRADGAQPGAVRFVLVAPYASRVTLVGDFNRWNPAAMPMRRATDGRTWTLEVPLPPGRHLYAFVVDGDLAADPAAPRAGDDDFGAPSSVVVVVERRT